VRNRVRVRVRVGIKVRDTVRDAVRVLGPRVRLFSPLRRLRCAICVAPNTESHTFKMTAMTSFRVPACLAVVKAECVHLCKVAGNTV